MSKKKTIFISIISSILAVIFIAIIYMTIVGILFKIVYTNNVVEGQSMYPTLNANVQNSGEGDIVYVNKYKEIKRNDIVVAKVGWWTLGPIVKRLIGIPCDRIKIGTKTIDDTYVYALIVNDEIVCTRSHNIINQEYVDNFNAYLVSHGFLDLTLVLGEDEYFLMGDNWAASEDCTKHGPISKSSFIGRVDYVIDSQKDFKWENIKYMFLFPFYV